MQAPLFALAYIRPGTGSPFRMLDTRILLAIGVLLGLGLLVLLVARWLHRDDAETPGSE